jgi:isopenicillin-N N-acyltransferase-like protein
VWSIEHGAGRFTRTFTEAGIVGKAGVNSAGLGLAINFLATDRDGGLDGVPVHVLCRTILDEARTVEDAIGLVEGAAVCASVCLTVAGQSGDGGHRAVALERWPDGVEAVATSTERPWVVHTNHFVREIPAHDLLAAGESAASTTDRLLQLTRALERDGALGADGAAALLSSRGEPGLEPIFRLDDPSVPWSQRCATLATILIESPSGRLSVRAA